MQNIFSLLLIALVALIGPAGRQCEAAIYQYVDEKGDPALVDDLNKVPEQQRTSAKLVSGQVTTERTEEERVREVARVAVARQAEAELQARAETSKKNRFILSGIVTAGIIIVLVIMANLHVLKGHDKITSRVRTTLIAILVVYLGIMHARDVMGLFGKASGTIQNVQDEQAKRGRKAAEFYKALDQALDQKVQEAQEAARKAEGGQAEEQH